MKIDDSKRPRTALKTYFAKNAIPTEAQFAELIDSTLNQRDDGFVKNAADPLSIEAGGDDVSLKKAVSFYMSFADADPAWSIALRPRRTPGDPATARPGWSVIDASGNSRLSIDAATGNVGIGTVAPADKLEVAGRVRAGTLSIGPWPHDANYNFIGSNLLDQVNPGNYAMLQGAGSEPGVTYVNSPSRIGMRIANNDRLTVTGDAVQIVVPLHVSDSLDAGGMAMGKWPANSNYSYVGTSQLNQADQANYALLQGTSSDTGSTYLNSPNVLHMRIGNSERMFIDGDSIDTRVRLNLGNSDVYFTKVDHAHTGFGNAAGNAAIENDGGQYGALMILGRAVSTSPLRRVVKLWDYLQVNGTLDVTGDLNYNGSLNQLNVRDSFTATVRSADFRFGSPGRSGPRLPAGGRAFVDGTDTLILNFGPDWPKTLIDGQTIITHLAGGSSRALKDDIAPLSSSAAVQVLDALDPVSFTWKTHGQRPSLGFIAEDSPAEVLNAEGNAIYYNHIVAALTRCVKDQGLAIDALTQRLAAVTA